MTPQTMENPALLTPQTRNNCPEDPEDALQVPEDDPVRFLFNCFARIEHLLSLHFFRHTSPYPFTQLRDAVNRSLEGGIFTLNHFCTILGIFPDAYSVQDVRRTTQHAGTYSLNNDTFTFSVSPPTGLSPWQMSRLTKERELQFVSSIRRYSRAAAPLPAVDLAEFVVASPPKRKSDGDVTRSMQKTKKQLVIQDEHQLLQKIRAREKLRKSTALTEEEKHASFIQSKAPLVLKILASLETNNSKPKSYTCEELARRLGDSLFLARKHTETHLTRQELNDTLLFIHKTVPEFLQIIPLTGASDVSEAPPESLDGPVAVRLDLPRGNAAVEMFQTRVRGSGWASGVEWGEKGEQGGRRSSIDRREGSGAL